MAKLHDEDGVEYWDLEFIDSGDLIDDYWYPYGNYLENQVTPEFIERHVSIRDKGFYSECCSHIASAYGYCLKDFEYYEVSNAAEHATQAMVKSTVLKNRVLNEYENKAFEYAYTQGFMKGQEAIAKQLYELALLGEFKAIDKFLEVRGAFGGEQSDSGPQVLINVSNEVKTAIESDSKVIKFPSKQS